jgi:hypothetical protein
MVIDLPVAAFYVRAEDISEAGIVEVAPSAAVPHLDPDRPPLRVRGPAFVVDADDDIASAIVVRLLADAIVLQVRDDLAPTSLADVEARALVHAAQAAERSRGLA